MNWAAAGMVFAIILGLGAAIFLAGVWVRMCEYRWGHQWWGFWLAMGGPFVLFAVALALYAGLAA